MLKQILLIDDDESLCRVLEFSLTEAGYFVHCAYSAIQGLELFYRFRPTIVITDIQLPDFSGFEIFQKIQTIDNKNKPTIFIFITGFSKIPEAITAIKAGVFDYLTKPFSPEQLQHTVQKALECRRSQRDSFEKERIETSEKKVNIIGSSTIMQELMHKIRKVAASGASVLLSGESGTGKELIARAIHQNSPQAQKPFVAVNCAAIPKNLLESELFGHVKGAFTGASEDRSGKFIQADGGTLFLDEVGELPIESQPKLLRAIQEREVEPVGGLPRKVNVRIISATNINIENYLATNQFREDLYYRIAVIPIRIPPLRHRKEDLPALVNFFLDKIGMKDSVIFTEEAMAAIREYNWPGNVRELQNVIEQTLILTSSYQIQKKDLPPTISNHGRAGQSLFKLPDTGYSLDDLEKEAITQALKMSFGNKTKAAEFLKISRHTLKYRIEKHGIDL